MAGSPPVTRKRYASNYRKGAAELTRVVADKRNKLIRAMPKRIPGVKGLSKSEVKKDLKEIRAFASTEVLDAEEATPKGTMVTPRPLIPKASHLEEKRARLARWKNNPSLVERDMTKKREAVSKAEDEDALVEAQQETWEQGYLVLRAHLMARHRPTASWSRTAGVTTPPNTATPAIGADASNKFPVLATGEMEAASQEENSRASGVGGGESPDGGDSRCGNVAINIDSRRREGELLGSPDAARGGGAVWSCEGEEEEEEASLRELEQVVMKRAGLEGEFDMKKVIKVLTDQSRQVMSARRERASLLAQHQPQSQKQKGNGNDEAKKGLDNAHPGDIALLGRWEELLRAGDLMRMGCRVSNGVDDAIDEASDAEDTLLRTKSASLLIPRGLDLPPSMRAPRYPTLLKQLQQEEQQRKKHEGATRRVKETSRNGSSAIEIEVGNDESGDASTVAKRTAGVMERVPWLGIGAYSGGVGGGQVVPTAEVEVATKTPGSMQTIASVESCIGGRVQWFPRSVPMEMAKSEGGYDERQSAYYTSKTSQAMDRLRNLMKEMAERQEEMERRRRQKVEESVGLVRAVADHETLRQEHLKRMKTLRKQLKKLEAAKGRNPSAAAAVNKPVGENTNDAEAKDEPSSRENRGDEGRETISFYKPNPAPGPIFASASASNADTNIDIGTASGDGPGGALTTDSTGTAAYAAAPPASPAPSSNVAAGVTMAMTRSRSPLIRGVLKTTSIPIPMSIKDKDQRKGKGREANVRGEESALGYQQQQQAARGERREEDAALAASSIPPTSPPSSSSPCPSPSSGPKKAVGVVELSEGDEALLNGGGGDGGGDRSEGKGSDKGDDREGAHGNEDKEENSASDSKDPLAGIFFKGVAADSRKRALEKEARGGVAVRVVAKRRRSADVIVAMSANGKIGSGRNAPTANEETSSKAKTITSGKRGGSTRLGSRGRRGGRK